MAVKAAATITLYTAASVTAVYRYYKLQLSVAAAPAKPTAKPSDTQKEAPSGWEVAEPAYTTGSTNSLYSESPVRVVKDDIGVQSDLDGSLAVVYAEKSGRVRG